MATRKGLRVEPYDPDSIDADNDGIVQEGSAWERPAGTRLLDELGREIIRGATSGSRPSGIGVVDRSGSRIDYKPSYAPRNMPAAGGKPGTRQQQMSTLGRLGYPSLKERGLKSVGEIHGREAIGPKVDEITTSLEARQTPTS